MHTNVHDSCLLNKKTQKKYIELFHTKFKRNIEEIYQTYIIIEHSKRSELIILCYWIKWIKFNFKFSFVNCPIFVPLFSIISANHNLIISEWNIHKSFQRDYTAKIERTISHNKMQGSVTLHNLIGGVCEDHVLLWRQNMFNVKTWIFQYKMKRMCIVWKNRITRTFTRVHWLCVFFSIVIKWELVQLWLRFSRGV